MKIKHNSWKISGPELGTPKAPNTHLSPLSKLAYKNEPLPNTLQVTKVTNLMAGKVCLWYLILETEKNIWDLAVYYLSW